jgi:hypothetical protein
MVFIIRSIKYTLEFLILLCKKIYEYKNENKKIISSRAIVVLR